MNDRLPPLHQLSKSYSGVLLMGLSTPALGDKDQRAAQAMYVVEAVSTCPPCYPSASTVLWMSCIPCGPVMLKS